MVTKAQKCAVKSQVGRKTAKASKLNEPDSDRDVQWGAASKENDWVDEDVEVVDTPPSRGNKISSGSTALFENRPPPDNLELRPPVQLVQAVIGCKFPTTPPGDVFRLPFLSRNLMKGFVGRCIEEDGASLHTKVDPPFTTTVAYRLAGTDCIHRASWDSSLCPLCPAYKYFRCQRTLKTHLAWDHDDVDVKWNTMSTVRVLLLCTPLRLNFFSLGRDTSRASLACTCESISPKDRHVALQFRFFQPICQNSQGPHAQLLWFYRTGEIAHSFNAWSRCRHAKLEGRGRRTDTAIRDRR